MILNIFHDAFQFFLYSKLPGLFIKHYCKGESRILCSNMYLYYKYPKTIVDIGGYVRNHKMGVKGVVQIVFIHFSLFFFPRVPRAAGRGGSMNWVEPLFSLCPCIGEYLHGR